MSPETLRKHSNQLTCHHRYRRNLALDESLLWQVLKEVAVGSQRPEGATRSAHHGLEGLAGYLPQTRTRVRCIGAVQRGYELVIDSLSGWCVDPLQVLESPGLGPYTGEQAFSVTAVGYGLQTCGGCARAETKPGGQMTSRSVRSAWCRIANATYKVTLLGSPPNEEIYL